MKVDESGCKWLMLMLWPQVKWSGAVWVVAHVTNSTFHLFNANGSSWCNSSSSCNCREGRQSQTKYQSVKKTFFKVLQISTWAVNTWHWLAHPAHLFSQLPSWGAAAGFTSIGPTVNLGKTSRKVLSVDDPSEGWILSENLLPLNKKADRWGGIWTHRGSHFSKIGFTLSRFQEASKDWLIPTLIELIHYHTAHFSVLHWFTPLLILHRNMFYDNDNVLL